ncbi:MAG: response regulator transcription factor [Phycisphaerae bacterium]
MPIRVLVADDHELMREGLISMLAGEADFEVVGEAGNGRRAVELAGKLAPDVVVLDITMPDLNGVEAARIIHSRLPKAKIVALSMHQEHRLVMDMMKAGASGYLPKSSAFEELGRAIRCVSSGKMYLSPTVTAPVLGDLLKHMEAAKDPPGPVLTGREREVLQLIAEGKGTKQIAAGLHVSVNTVTRHRQHIMDKLEIRGVAELTKYAIREGISSL